MLESCWSVGWLVVANTELRPVSPSNTWRRQQHGDVGTLKSRKYLDGLPCRHDHNLASLRKHTIGRHFEFVDDCHLPRCMHGPASVTSTRCCAAWSTLLHS